MDGCLRDAVEFLSILIYDTSYKVRRLQDKNPCFGRHYRALREVLITTLS